VALGPFGREVFDVVTPDGILTQYSSTNGISILQGGVRQAGVVITPSNIELLNVVFQTGVLIQYTDQGGVYPLMGGVADASEAINPTNGQPDLVVLFTNGTIKEFSPLLPGGQQAQLGYVLPASLTVSFTPGGVRVLEVLQTDGTIVRNAAGVTQTLPLPFAVGAEADVFTPSGVEVHDVAYQNNVFVQYDSLGHVYGLPGNAAAVASAFSNFGFGVLVVFGVDGSLTQYDTSGNVLRLPTF
jgi:hypothetical protein